jgi:hypothetical protein
MAIIAIFSPGKKTKETQRETLIRRRFLQGKNLEGPSAHSTRHRVRVEKKRGQGGIVAL